MLRPRSWMVVRVVEYRLQFLAFPDTWDDLSSGTWVTTDREEAYQAARAVRGLLLGTNGLPSTQALEEFERLAGAFEAAGSTA